MSWIQGRRILAAAVGAASLVAVLTGAGGMWAEAKAGVAWRDLSIDDAIAEARAKDTMVIVDVWDSHCGACLQLDTDVWNTPDGEKVVEGLVPIKIQSTVDIGHAFMTRYPVTGLPGVVPPMSTPPDSRPKSGIVPRLVRRGGPEATIGCALPAPGGTNVSGSVRSARKIAVSFTTLTSLAIPS